MRAVLEATEQKNYSQLAQAFKMTCIQRFGVEKAAEICKDDALSERSDAIAQVFQDEMEAMAVAAASQPPGNGPLAILKDEREVQSFPGRMAWLFEPYLQDLYERRQWQEIERFEKFSTGARLVAALVLATARTGELVSASESAELDKFHAERRKWLVGYLLGRTLRPRLPRQAGRRDAVVVRRGGGRLRRAAAAPAAPAARRGGAGVRPPARAPALVPGRRRRPGAVPRPRAGAAADGGAGRRRRPTRS